MIVLSIKDDKTVQILEQTFYNASHIATNNVYVSCSSFPAVYYDDRLKIFLRGDDSSKKYNALIFRSLEDTLKGIVAIKEYCDYYNSGFKITQGRIKIE